MAANGVEICRQVVPRNPPELVELLIESGAGVTWDVAALLRASGAHG